MDEIGTADTEKAAKKAAREALWERESAMRFAMLEAQHEEVMALHADFASRSERATVDAEARLADYRSAIEHRRQHGLFLLAFTELMQKQNAIFERIAAALEK
jgi:hypothetical protein